MGLSISVQISPKKWLLCSSLAVLLGLVLQFYIFRLPAVYDLCLKTHLYDNVWWVARPAKQLILGSSNAMNGISPPQISELNGFELEYALNLGLNGATPFVMLRNLNLYHEKFGPPERLDIVISPLMYQEYYHTAKEYEKIWLNPSQWEVVENEGVTNSYYFPAMIFWQCLHFDQQEIFRQYHYDLKTKRERRGFDPIYENGIKADIKDKNFPRLDANFTWSKPLLACLDSMLQYAELHHTQVYFILTPIRPDLYRKYQETPSLFEGLESVLEKRPPQRWLGSMNPEDFHLSEQHFLNPDHLTGQGAEIFTRRIYSNVKDHPNILRQDRVRLLDMKFLP